jgi:hypothetical protein
MFSTTKEHVPKAEMQADVQLFFRRQDSSYHVGYLLKRPGSRVSTNGVMVGTPDDQYQRKFLRDPTGVSGSAAADAETKASVEIKPRYNGVRSAADLN